MKISPHPAILPGEINLRIVAFIVSLRLAMHEAGN